MTWTTKKNPMPKILIVDPLTLLGREALRLLADEPFLSANVAYVHTAVEDEHEIAELAGEPALVPPLDDPSQILEADAVLVASDVATPRLGHVLELASSESATSIVVMSPVLSYWDSLTPAAGADVERTSNHLRVAHPALVVLWTLIGTLGYLDPEWATVAALDPVSAGGTEDVERLARQAAQRLQGAQVEERIADQVLAFTMVAADDEDLNRDVSLLMPDLEIAATRTATGCFHGHVAQIGIGFASPVEELEVLEALRNDERLAEPDLPLTLDSCTDTDLIGLSAPRLSRHGRILSVTTMVDGLRIGGARTAIEILRSMI